MNTIVIKPEKEKIEAEFFGQKIEATGFIVYVLVTFIFIIALYWIKETHGHKIKTFFKNRKTRSKK